MVDEVSDLWPVVIGTAFLCICFGIVGYCLGRDLNQRFVPYAVPTPTPAPLVVPVWRCPDGSPEHP